MNLDKIDQTYNRQGRIERLSGICRIIEQIVVMSAKKSMSKIDKTIQNLSFTELPFKNKLFSQFEKAMEIMFVSSALKIKYGGTISSYHSNYQSL